MAQACPISSQRIDAGRVRMAAWIMSCFVLLFLVTGNILWFLPVLVDMAFRVAGWSAYAPMLLLARQINRLSRAAPKFEDAAPKRFAAQVGVLVSLAIAASWLLVFVKTSVSLAVVLLACMLLEAAFGFCVGCRLYGLAQLLKRR